MRAAVKGIYNDLVDVATYFPEALDDFNLSLRIKIGLDCTEGADDFELLVCTPKWLEGAVWEPRWGRGLLVVKAYDFQAIKDFVEGYVTSCEGDSWESIVMQLGKVLTWEFDGY